MRLGVLGGTFNPIHNGHTAMAEAAITEFGLDKVLLMVTADPPHKPGDDAAGANIRLSLAKVAAAELKDVEVSDMEIRRGGKSYTIDTIKSLKAIYEGAELYFIVGMDMLLTLLQWRSAEELLKLCSFIYFNRQCDSADANEFIPRLKNEYGASVFGSNACIPDISSSQVRSAVYEAQPVSHLVHDKVEALIYELGLYLPESIRQMQEKLKSMLKCKRYVHTMGTVRYAVYLASRHNVDCKKARLAALLHDCGKNSPDLLLDARAHGLTPDESELASIGLLHAKLGAIKAKELFGVDDQEVLSAIECHTLGKPHMTKLEKLIYVADMIEPNRSFAGVEALRELAARDLDAAFIECLKESIKFVDGKGKAPHPISYKALKHN